tara:strand:+ start:176 stop:1003 length:828 start_codon:yes stop_codon:yes gene_type:complete
MKEKVICYGSAIRPQYWMEIWEQLTNTNNIEFEILYSGHIKPDYELPKNLHHIYSELGAAPCVEIVRRLAHASGCRYMLNCTDDYFRISPGFLDELVKDVRDANDCGHEDYITCAMFRVSPTPPWDQHDTPLIYHNEDLGSPQLHTWMFHPTKTSVKLGSIDKRFSAQYWDVDLQMRNYELGGTGGQQKSVEMTERPPEPGALSPKYAAKDRGVLDSFWCPVSNGKKDEKGRYFYDKDIPPNKRSSEVRPYTDEELRYLKDNNLSSWEEYWIRHA